MLEKDVEQESNVGKNDVENVDVKMYNEDNSAKFQLRCHFGMFPAVAASQNLGNSQ